MAVGTRQVLVALVLGGAAALHFAAPSSADGPTIEPAGPGSAGYFWSPSTATVGLGGTVNFRSTSTTVPHGVHWTGGPEKPTCSSGVPVDQEKEGWSGGCTFAQAGTYAFVCTVHPTEMKGTITVTASEVPPVTPPPPGGSPESQPESPLQGSALPRPEACEEPARQLRVGLGRPLAGERRRQARGPPAREAGVDSGRELGEHPSRSPRPLPDRSRPCLLRRRARGSRPPRAA